MSFQILRNQKVVDCLKKSVDFESMNACNVHLEKYIKKNIEEAKNQEEKEQIDLPDFYERDFGPN